MQVVVVVMGRRLLASESQFHLGQPQLNVKARRLPWGHGEIVGIFTLFDDGRLYWCLWYFAGMGFSRVPGHRHRFVRWCPLVAWQPRGDGDGRACACCPFLTQYVRCCALFPAVRVYGAPGHNRWGEAETPLPAKSQGEEHGLSFSSLTCPSLGAGCCLGVSRQGVQSPRYREHAHGAVAVSTGPQQARSTDGSGCTATVGPHREPQVCPRSTVFKRQPPGSD